MTVLQNEVVVHAPVERVFEILASPDALERYDPAISRSRAVEGPLRGLGASRHCDLADKGWFRERVTLFEPPHALEFTLTDCTLPVRGLRHRYTLVPEGARTRVRQEMEYALKYGAVGSLLDAAFVRRKWDAGIKSFLAGLKRYVEEGEGKVEAPAP